MQLCLHLGEVLIQNSPAAFLRKAQTPEGCLPATLGPNVRLMKEGRSSFSALGGKLKLPDFKIFQMLGFMLWVCVYTCFYDWMRKRNPFLASQIGIY